MKNLLILTILILLTIMGFRVIGKLSAMNDRINRLNVEYQFVVTDSTVTVYDANRVVGTIALEGQLRDLVECDNQ